jgi:3' terminal RNA ribose 2'-O-methyltransferase Hen1
MLLTITSTTAPATDLGYLLHKSPFRAQVSNLAFGKAHVFYPEAEPDRCTAALLVEVDPVGLVRGRGRSDGERRGLAQYVNDRPYVASSYLSVAIAEVFGSALSGRSRERPELALRELPFEARLSVVPCREGETLLRRLFEPLGYEVGASRHALDDTHADWGHSDYFTLTLAGAVRLCDLLTHLYVLIPVLDDDKHYWVGDDEIEKLTRRGEGWLATHPERELIARRYLKHQRSLTRQALEQLLADEGPVASGLQSASALDEAAIERRISLNEQRIAAVVEVLEQSGSKRVLDLGCGEGQLIRALLQREAFAEIVGVDVSHAALETASNRLRLEQMPERQRERIKLFQGSLTYRDRRIAGYDAAAVVEVIEHLDVSRLAAFERSVFEFARPGTVVVTTPNAEYNVKFEGLPAGHFRHSDHRFEWSRAEFEAWARRTAERFAYVVRFAAVGPEDDALGPPTQMAVFSR